MCYAGRHVGEQLLQVHMQRKTTLSFSAKPRPVSETQNRRISPGIEKQRRLNRMKETLTCMTNPHLRLSLRAFPCPRSCRVPRTRVPNRDPLPLRPRLHAPRLLLLPPTRAPRPRLPRGTRTDDDDPLQVRRRVHARDVSVRAS